jgi:DtxR family Mn-dependent transcriptional regulator
MAAVKKSSLSASLEDYLEAIYNLTAESNVARSKDIAKSLGVSKSSVTGALRLLKRKGLVNYKPYDYVTLTKTGWNTAAEIVQRHDILKSFFVDLLGIEADIAQQAACKTEHALGPEVIARLLCFIEFMTRENKDGFDFVTKFGKFYKGRLKNNRSRKNKHGK